MNEETYTVKEIANALKVDPETIRRHIRYGNIKAIKIGSDWRIHADERERLVRKGIHGTMED
jgi:excisionase family DNA binding protein